MRPFVAKTFVVGLSLWSQVQATDANSRHMVLELGDASFIEIPMAHKTEITTVDSVVTIAGDSVYSYNISEVRGFCFKKDAENNQTGDDENAPHLYLGVRWNLPYEYCTWTFDVDSLDRCINRLEVEDDDIFSKNYLFGIVPVRGVTNLFKTALIKVTIGTVPYHASSSGAVDGHTYVDLGLKSGLLWATCNVGAERPEDFGSYFAWGETETKEVYNWNNYKHGLKDYLFKYCYVSDGDEDSLKSLASEDDVATTSWGEHWQLPTADDTYELRKGCDWICIENYNNTGVNGLLGVSKSNGNVIFLPSAGFRYDNELYAFNKECHYWLNSLWNGDLDAFALSRIGDATGGFIPYGRKRPMGCSVRPVIRRAK